MRLQNGAVPHYFKKSRAVYANPGTARVRDTLWLDLVRNSCVPKGWKFSSREVYFTFPRSGCARKNAVRGNNPVCSRSGLQMRCVGYAAAGMARKTCLNSLPAQQSEATMQGICSPFVNSDKERHLEQLPGSPFRTFTTFEGISNASCTIQLLADCVERQAYRGSAVCPFFWENISSACSTIDLSSPGELNLYLCSRRLRELVRLCVRLSCALRASYSTRDIKGLGIGSLHRMVCLLERFLLRVVAEIDLVFVLRGKSNLTKMPPPLSPCELSGFIKGYMYAREAIGILSEGGFTSREVLDFGGSSATHDSAEGSKGHASDSVVKQSNRASSGATWGCQVCDLYEEAFSGVLLKELSTFHRTTFVAGFGRGKFSQTLKGMRFSCATTATPLSSSYAFKATLSLEGLLQIISAFSPRPLQEGECLFLHKQHLAGSKQGLPHLKVPHSLLQLLERMIWERKGDFQVEPIPCNKCVPAVKLSERGDFITSWDEEQANCLAESAEVEQLVFAARVFSDYEHSKSCAKNPTFYFAFQLIGEALLPMIGVLLTTKAFNGKHLEHQPDLTIATKVRDPLCRCRDATHPEYFTEEWLLFPWLRRDNSSFLVLQLVGAFAKAGVCHQSLLNAICWGLVKPQPTELSKGLLGTNTYCLLDKWSSESVCCYVNLLCTLNYEGGHFLRFVFTRYMPSTSSWGVRENTGNGTLSKLQDPLVNPCALRLFKKQQSAFRRFFERQPWQLCLRNSHIKSLLRTDLAKCTHHHAFPSHLRAASLKAKTAANRLFRLQESVISTRAALAESHVLAKIAGVDEADYLAHSRKPIKGDRSDSWMLLPVIQSGLRRLMCIMSYTRRMAHSRFERSFDSCSVGSVASLFNAVAASNCIPPSPQWIENLINQVWRVETGENSYLESFIHVLPYLPPLSAMLLVSGNLRKTRGYNALRLEVTPGLRALKLSHLPKDVIMSLPTAQLPELLIGIVLHTPPPTEFLVQARRDEFCDVFGPHGIENDGKFRQHLATRGTVKSAICWNIPAFALTIKVALRRMLDIWANSISPYITTSYLPICSSELLNTLSKIPEFNAPCRSLFKNLRCNASRDFSAAPHTSSVDHYTPANYGRLCRQLMIAMTLYFYTGKYADTGKRKTNSQQGQKSLMGKNVERQETESGLNVALQPLTLGVLRELHATCSLISALMSMERSTYPDEKAEKVERTSSRAGATACGKLRKIERPKAASDFSRPEGGHSAAHPTIGKSMSVPTCGPHATVNGPHIGTIHGIHSSKFQRQVLLSVEVCSDTLDRHFPRRMGNNIKQEFGDSSDCIPRAFLPDDMDRKRTGQEYSPQWKISTEACVGPYFIDILVERRR